MIQLTVNEQPLTFEGDPHMPLLWFLRDEAGLTGTKFGCCRHFPGRGRA